MRSALTILLSAAVLCGLLLAQSISVSPIRFEDTAERAGVHFVVENSPTPEKHQPETIPAGSITTACFITTATEPLPTLRNTPESREQVMEWAPPLAITITTAGPICLSRTSTGISCFTIMETEPLPMSRRRPV